MKRLFIILTFLFITGFCFAETSNRQVESCKEKVLNFFNKGNCIIIIDVSGDCKIVNKPYINKIIVTNYGFVIHFQDSEELYLFEDKKIYYHKDVLVELTNDTDNNLVIKYSLSK